MSDFTSPFGEALGSSALSAQACARDTVETFAESVAAGLSDEPKWLPRRFLYDAESRRLFSALIEQPEYYPSRLESALLSRHAGDMREVTGPVTVIELGSGFSTMIEPLLSAYSDDGLETAHFPVDVRASELPVLSGPSRNLVAFLGSALGQFSGTERETFFKSLARRLPAGDYLLLAVDLVKDEAVLEAAHDDDAGLTARLTANYFARMNRELGSGIDLDEVDHVAAWNRRRQRMEISARFNETQLIRVEPLNAVFEICAGEEVLIEINRKFRLPSLMADLSRCGFRLQRAFTDEDAWFGLLLVQRAGEGSEVS